MEDEPSSTHKDMTIEETSEFWDTHSVADYPSQIVEIEYAPEKRMVLIPIDIELLPEIERHAKEQGTSIEDLINSWVQERIASS